MPMYSSFSLGSRFISESYQKRTRCQESNTGAVRTKGGRLHPCELKIMKNDKCVNVLLKTFMIYNLFSFWFRFTFFIQSGCLSNRNTIDIHAAALNDDISCIIFSIGILFSFIRIHSFQQYMSFLCR